MGEDVLLPRGEVVSSGSGTQRVVRVPYRGGHVFVKLYGRKRGLVRDAVRGVGHRWGLGKTSMRPKVRRRVEKEVLGLWRECGFGSPRVLEIELAHRVSQPYLVLEEVQGVPLSRTLLDPAYSKKDLSGRVERFALDCGRRHEQAIGRREPRLVHTHPSFTHVLERGEELVYLDHECAYADPSRISLYISHEIAGFAAALLRHCHQSTHLLETLVDVYPNRDRLARVARDVGSGRIHIPESWGAVHSFLAGWRRSRRRVSGANVLSATLARRDLPDGVAEGPRRGGVRESRVSLTDPRTV